MTRHHRPTTRAAASFAAGLLCMAGAGAQTSPYYIGGGLTLGHESNLLGLGPGQSAKPGFSKADTVTTASLLGGFDQPFGRQRAYANVSVRDNRYSKNTAFNNTGYSASAGLEWQTVNRISGSLTGSATHSLQRFTTEEIDLQTEKNLETVQTLNGRVSIGLVTAYTFELTGGHRLVRNSLENPNVQARRFSQDSLSLGLRWSDSPALSLGVALDVAKGRYPRFATNAAGQYEADRFDRNNVEFSATLRPSGASTFDLRLSVGKTSYDLNQQRNFSGLTGNAIWAWQATGKLRLNTSVNRDTGQDSYAVAVDNTPTRSDYSRTTTVYRTQLVWEASAKISLNTGLSYYDRSIVRTVPNPTRPLDAQGREGTTQFGIGARWVPTRYAQLGCDFNQQDRRGSGELSSDLRGNTFSCYGQIVLQ